MVNLSLELITSLQVRWSCRHDKKDGCLSVSGGVLLGVLGHDLLSALLEFGLGLKTHDASTPSALWTVVELRLEVLLEGLQLALVFLVHFGDSDDGGVLLVGESSQSGLSLNNAERDVHLAA